MPAQGGVIINQHCFQREDDSGVVDCVTHKHCHLCLLVYNFGHSFLFKNHTNFIKKKRITQIHTLMKSSEKKKRKAKVDISNPNLLQMSYPQKGIPLQFTSTTV